MWDSCVVAPSPPALRTIHKCAQDSSASCTHMLMHVHTPVPLPSGNQLSLPHSQKTLSQMVLSVVNRDPWHFTLQVRLVSWSQSLGVKMSTEEWRFWGFRESTAAPAQKKLAGLPPWQDPGRLQLSCVDRPDSRGSTMRMSGLSVRAEEDTGRWLGPGD